MQEPEIHFPLKCPICAKEMLAGFRVSIVANAFDTGDIRLYSICHVASWDASQAELAQIREFWHATWQGKLTHAGQERSVDEHAPCNGTYGGLSLIGSDDTHVMGR
jgi:hypothetical protein